MEIVGLPTDYDNYIWVIRSKADAKLAWVVDPGESHRVIPYFQEHNLTLAGILLTHHHYDHTDGIVDILATLGNAPVISNQRGPFKLVSQHIEAGEVISIADHDFEILATPGHTHEHIAFYHPEALFCGDVLFTAGCGKAWHQSAKPMAESLIKLRNLDENCWVYCGHEYTYGNINFAAIAEPNNPDILARQAEVKRKTQQGIPCVPERLSIEKKTNPFLRFDQTELKQTLLNQNKIFENFKADDNGNLYASLRAWKDSLDQTGCLEAGLND